MMPGCSLTVGNGDLFKRSSAAEPEGVGFRGFDFSRIQFILQSGREPERGDQRLSLLHPEEMPERILRVGGLIGEHLKSTDHQW